MGDYTKPLPLITTLSKVFYDACKENKLIYQHCPDCGCDPIFFPKHMCPDCLGENLGWKVSKGKGRIYSFTVALDSAPPEFWGDMPYILAIVELDEGFRMMSNIVMCDPNDVTCDKRVEIVFDPVTPEVTLPKFRLAD